MKLPEVPVATELFKDDLNDSHLMLDNVGEGSALDSTRVEKFHEFSRRTLMIALISADDLADTFTSSSELATFTEPFGRIHVPSLTSLSFVILTYSNN